MTTKEFKTKFYPGIFAACLETGLNPLFVAAQAALETGWGKHSIGNNLFGITAGKSWKGKTQVRTTTEYLNDANQGHLFTRVHSITPMQNGKFMYKVDRVFRDYSSVKDCILDHFKVLSLPRYKAAFEFKNDVRLFAYHVAKCGYATADPNVYADSISKIARMIENA